MYNITLDLFQGVFFTVLIKKMLENSGFSYYSNIQRYLWQKKLRLT